MGVTGNPLRIVVFGGIGSGKTTLVRQLEALGAVAIAADSIGHEVIRSDGAAFAAVSHRWPQVVVDGEIDRQALAGIVFADRSQLAELEAITHPLIGAEITRRAAAAGDRPVVVELPLVVDLVGEGWIWVLVDAPRPDRMERAVARGAAAEDVAARMDSQPTIEQWHAKADWIVPNTGSVDDLADAAQELWKQLHDQLHDH